MERVRQEYAREDSLRKGSAYLQQESVSLHFLTQRCVKVLVNDIDIWGYCKPSRDDPGHAGEVGTGNELGIPARGGSGSLLEGGLTRLLSQS